MLLKTIAFLAAAVPIFLFLRSILFRRSTRLRESMREFQRNVDFAVWVFLVIVGVVVVFALGKLVWTWLSAT